MHEQTRKGSVNASVTGMVSDVLTLCFLVCMGGSVRRRRRGGRSNGALGTKRKRKALAEEGAIVCRRTYGGWTRGGEGRKST